MDSTDYCMDLGLSLEMGDWRAGSHWRALSGE